MGPPVWATLAPYGGIIVSLFLDSTGEALEIFGEDFLIFTLAGTRYGLAYAQVEEMRPYETQAVQPLTLAMPSVAGKAYVSGAYAPVIDLRRRLGLAPAGPAAAGMILFVRVHEHRAGLLVDATEGVTIVDRDQLDTSAKPSALPIPDIAVLGQKVSPDGPIWLVNLESLLPEDEVARASRAVDAEATPEKQHA